MDMNQAAVFLAGSILTMAGFVVITVGIIVINNLLSKHWKPVRMFTYDSWFINPPTQNGVVNAESEEKRNAVSKD